MSLGVASFKFPYLLTYTFDWKVLSILESTRHKLSNTHGLTLVIPSLHGWEVFFNARGPHPHYNHWAPLTFDGPSLWCHFVVPLVSIVLQPLLMGRCAINMPQPTNLLPYKDSSSIHFYFNIPFILPYLKGSFGTK